MNPDVQALLKAFGDNGAMMASLGEYIQKAAVTNGTYTFSPDSRSIFTAENLDHVIKLIIPQSTPIRSVIPRSSGSGQAAAWHRLTSKLDPSATGTGTTPFFADAGTPGETTQTYTTESAAYKLLGRKLSLGLMHIASSQGNPAGNAEDQLLRTKTLEVMLGEEWSIINSDSAVHTNGFDGLLKQITTNSGTSALLTASGVAVYDQTIFEAGGVATHLFIGPRQKRALADQLEKTGAIQRIMIQDQKGAVANASVKAIISPNTDQEIQLVTSRYMGNWAILGAVTSPSGEAYVDMQDLIPMIKMDVPVTTFARDSFIVEATVLRLMAEPYWYKIGGLAV